MTINEPGEERLPRSLDDLGAFWKFCTAIGSDRGNPWSIQQHRAPVPPMIFALDQENIANSERHEKKGSGPQNVHDSFDVALHFDFWKDGFELTFFINHERAALDPPVRFSVHALLLVHPIGL